MLSRKLKLKQQYDSTMHLLEWPKSRALTMLNADEDVDNRTGVNAVASEIALLMELKDGTTTLENSWEFSPEIEDVCFAPLQLYF